MQALVPRGLVVALVLSLAGAAGCSDPSADGAGTVAFTTWGEEYIEQQIPPVSAEGETIVEDGWTIRFTKFLVVLGDLTVADGSAAPAAALPAFRLFDMHAPGEKAVASFAGLPARAYSHVSFAISPATAAVEVAAGVAAGDRDAMVTNGYSLYVEASATKDAAAKTFRWGFRTNTLYEHCRGELAGKETDGVVVTNGGTDTAQLTIHGDHFFYDDLQAASAKVRFDVLARSDTNDDGEITLEELAGVKLADDTIVPAGKYGTGTQDVTDLRAFVEALSRTVGHFRGEGECLSRPRGPGP